MNNCVGFGEVGVSRTGHNEIGMISCLAAIRSPFFQYTVLLQNRVTTLATLNGNIYSYTGNVRGGASTELSELYLTHSTNWQFIVRLVSDLSFNWVVRGSNSHDTIYKLITRQLSRNHGIVRSCDTVLKLSKLPIDWSSNNGCGLCMIWGSRGAKDTGDTKLGSYRTWLLSTPLYSIHGVT